MAKQIKLVSITTAVVSATASYFGCYVITELKNVKNMVTLPRNKTLLQTLDLAVFLLFKNLKIRPQWRIQGSMLRPPAPLVLP